MYEFMADCENPNADMDDNMIVQNVPVCETCDSEELSCKTCKENFHQVEGKCCPGTDETEANSMCEFREVDGV